MLWTLASLAWAQPPALTPADLQWLPGLWASTSPTKFVQGQPAGALLVVLDGPRSTGTGRTATVHQLTQTVYGTHPGPSLLQEEIWFEPTGTFLIVWSGSSTGQVRLLPSKVEAGHVVFEGDPSAFPARVELSRNGKGIVVVHQGTHQGVPVRLEWRYEPTEPLRPVMPKK